MFSAFKSANQTQTLENLKAASKAANFTEYAAEVQSVVNDYNINHLHTEWATAKKACRTAKRWQKALENADLFTNIEYLPSTAKDPRDNHKAYYGMVRPISDPAWDSILPPSDWGCQCGWRTTDKEATGKPSEAPKAVPGLDNNPGKDGAIFSQSHPHFKGGNTEAVLKQNIVEMYGVDLSEITEFHFDKKSKGCIFSIENVRSESEFSINMKTAKILKNKGSVVELLKRSEVEGVKSIDAIVNGIPTEFKMCGSRTSIDNAIRDAARKAKNLKVETDVVIHLSKDLTGDIVREAIESRMSRAKGVNNVFVIKGDKVVRF